MENIEMNPGKQLIKEFEDVKDKATLNVLSKLSLERPLTEQEFNDYRDAFHRYYGVPNIIKQDFRQARGEIVK